MKEIWKDIYFTDLRTNSLIDYRGLYQVSNYGNVRRMDSYIKNMHGTLSFRKGKTIKMWTNNKYKRVGLVKDTERKNYYVHDLVAYMFLPYPNGYMEVNHKDENKENNCVENLEWCSRNYNINYGTGRERSAKNHINHPKRSTPVIQYTIDNIYIATYPSIKEAYRQTGVYPQNISKCCKGIFKYAGNGKEKYIWVFA